MALGPVTSRLLAVCACSTCRRTLNSPACVQDLRTNFERLKQAYQTLQGELKESVAEKARPLPSSSYTSILSDI